MKDSQKKSAVLEGYTYFVEKVRENQRQEMNLEEAVDSAIKDCIDNHVLEDFFKNRRDEVKAGKINTHGRVCRWKSGRNA